ncbi:MAG: hypothetical protein GEU26_14540 [Nitrososphaeraceae archaeon]|nr:hypothetical protein [Nitrososphaeraceae archaeon]
MKDSGIINAAILIDKVGGNTNLYRGVRYPISMLRCPAEALEIDARLSTITEGLHNEFFNGLKSISKENASVILDYISAMNTETNPSDNYRKDNVRLLYSFSKFNKDKPFKSIIRDEVISFLNARRKPESSDPLHK